MPKAGGLWTIVKHMAKVRATPVAVSLGASHKITVICLLPDVFPSQRSVETWPSRSRVKLCVRAKQLISADHALVHSRLFVVVILASKGHLGAFVYAYLILLRCK